MKIIHIEDFFHPDAGYQINILPKYMAKMGHEVVIITSEMDKVPSNLTSFFGREEIEEKDKAYSDEFGVKIIRLPIKGFVSGRAIFTRRLFKTIKEEKPDVVYVHGNDTLTAMQYFLHSKKIGVPYLTDSHMLEMASQNKFNKIYRWVYRRVFTPILVKNKIIVIRTQNDRYVENCLGIPLEQAPWISVGSDVMLFKPDDRIRTKFRQENGISDDAFVIVYAGKLDANKGGLLLAEAIEKTFGSDREVVFVIVGKTSGEYGKQVENLFEKSQNRILRFPTQKYRDLSKFYQSSDLAVFPRQCSLSFYDVQACGLPVLSEDNNINVDRCSYNNGVNFKAESVESFREGIKLFLDMSQEKYDVMSKNAYHFVRENYSYADIAEQYTAIIKQTILDFSKKGKGEK